MYRLVLVILLLSLLHVCPKAQILFEDRSDLLLEDSKSSFAMGMCDIDGDFRDDISLLHEGRNLFVYLQDASPDNWKTLSKLGAFPQDLPWTFCAGDLDNDGHKEILVAGKDKGLFIYDLSKTNPLVQFIDDIFFSQATNFVDINNDGWLDLMACNDLGDNFIYLNDQTGQLVKSQNFIDWNTNPSSDNSGNYSSEWIDFDNDHDLDLSIVKCKEDVFSLNDPRRINMLYRNDGGGNFVNIAPSINADIPYQSWSQNWGDIDNDGDLDCYLINHDHAHIILLNSGSGNFVATENFTGGQFFGSAAIQSIFYDLDNDRDLDIIISGARDHILWNDGNGSFTDEEEPFAVGNIYSLAIGDINQDGFADLMTTLNGIVSVVGPNIDHLYSAIPNGNNYIKFSLEGTTSNRDAVGATLYLHGPWGRQRRDTRAGESYSIVNSSNVTFGLGNSSQVDSVEIFWPSGQREVYNDLSVNKQYLAIENSCLNPFEEVLVNGSFDCLGDQVSLSISAPAAAVVNWSDGQVGAQIMVSSPGNYSAEINLTGTCKTFSKIIYLSGPASVALPNISAEEGFAFCEGGSTNLSIDPYDNINWSHGGNETTTTVSDPGWYKVTVSLDNCPDEYVDSTFVELIPRPNPDFLGDTLDQAGDISIFAYGDSIHWFDKEWSSDIIHIGENFQNFEEQSRKYYARSIYKQKYPTISFDQDPPEDQSDLNESDGLWFNVLQACRLNSVSVISEVAGARTVELRNDLGTVLASKTIQIPQSQNYFELPLNFDLIPGVNYLLGTKTNDNVQNLGTLSPQLSIKTYTSDPYPFVIPDYLEITATKNGSQNFPYFFQWQLDQGDIVCKSDWTGVPVVIAGVSSLDQEFGEELSFIPNPVLDKLFIQSNKEGKVEIKIHSFNGIEVFSKDCLPNSWIDLSFLETSMYLLSYKTPNQMFWQYQKLIKI